MNDQEFTKELLEKIGGKENIRAVGHCSTRLRLTLHDKTKVDGEAIEEIEGVKGQFFSGEQYQIILGTGFVNRIYDIVAGEQSSVSKDIKADLYANMSLPQKVSRILGDVFIPVIPVLVATGLFSGFINLIRAFGLPMDDNVMAIATVLMKTAFNFLPVLIAWSAIQNFGGSPVIGIVLGLMLVAPQLPNPNDVINGVAEPIIFQVFGMKLQIVGYQGSVLPALAVAVIAAKLEQYLRKKVPDMLELIVVPFATIFVSGMLALFIVGPILHVIELGVLSAAKAVIALPFGLGGLILGGTQQAIVVTGVHHIFLALETEFLATTGYNPFNAMITGGIISQATAALCVGLKTKNKKKRNLYITSSFPAFLGITEPAIFGVNLKFGKPFLFALCGGASAGLTAGLLHAKGTGMGVAAIPGIVTYMYSSEALAHYFIIHAVGMAVTATLVFLFYHSPEKDETAAFAEVPDNALAAPVSGCMIPIESVKDETFASKMMGDGVAFEPAGEVIAAPCSGTLSVLADTGHAFGISRADGMEVLVHIGINTVEMNGSGFTALAEAGTEVKAGQPVIKADLELLRRKGYDLTTMLIITDDNGHPVSFKENGEVELGEVISL